MKVHIILSHIDARMFCLGVKVYAILVYIPEWYKKQKTKEKVSKNIHILLVLKTM
jgi:hypothetical protein